MQVVSGKQNDMALDTRGEPLWDDKINNGDEFSLSAWNTLHYFARANKAFSISLGQHKDAFKWNLKYRFVSSCLFYFEYPSFRTDLQTVQMFTWQLTLSDSAVVSSHFVFPGLFFMLVKNCSSLALKTWVRARMWYLFIYVTTLNYFQFSLNTD